MGLERLQNIRINIKLTWAAWNYLGEKILFVGVHADTAQHVAGEGPLPRASVSASCFLYQQDYVPCHVPHLAIHTKP